MAVNAPKLILDNWHHFTANGATKKCTYKQMGTSSSVDGVVTTPVLSTTPDIEIVFDKIKAFLVDGSTIRLIDRVAIFPTLLLPVEAVIGDLIVDPSAVEWKVKHVGTDPTSAVWELRVRPVNG